MVSKPVVSSIRSKQTGHVGSSTRDGVGGATGFVDKVEGTSFEEAVAAPLVFDKSVIVCG